MLTGCTKTLTGEDKKAVKYEETGKALTENILCKPTNKDVIDYTKKIKLMLINYQVVKTLNLFLSMKDYGQQYL